MEHKTRTPEAKPAVNQPPDAPARRPYHAPELTSYGDLCSMTQGGSGKPNDAMGVPSLGE